MRNQNALGGRHHGTNASSFRFSFAAALLQVLRLGGIRLKFSSGFGFRSGLSCCLSNLFGRCCIRSLCRLGSCSCLGSLGGFDSSNINHRDRLEDLADGGLWFCLCKRRSGCFGLCLSGCFGSFLSYQSGGSSSAFLFKGCLPGILLFTRFAFFMHPALFSKFCFL